MIARGLIASIAAAGAVLAAPRGARADDAACIASTEASIPLRKGGKLHEAVKVLATCADPSCPEEVKAECAQRLQDVMRAMPTLSLVLKDQAGRDVAATVKVDGVLIPGAADGRPLDLDPGEHTIHVEAAGLLPVDRALVVRVGEKDRRESLVLVPPKPPSFWTTQRAVAATSIGLGVVGLAIGGVFTGFAASAKSRETTDCSTHACGNYPQAVADYNAASSNGTGATIGFAVGGVLAAAGIVLFATARKPRAPAPAATGMVLRLSPVVAGTRGLGIGGTF